MKLLGGGVKSSGLPVATQQKLSSSVYKYAFAEPSTPVIKL
jgi:hypothetical protein